MSGLLITLLILTSLDLITADQNSAVEEEEDPSAFDWSSWWSYDGISGPGFWGIINRRWRLCSDGRRQSPVDLATSSVVFDHTLTELTLASHKIDGTLVNTGFGLRWSVGTGQIWQVSGGPLLYTHTLAHAVLRWSNDATTTHTVGSEHSIQGQFFPGEHWKAMTTRPC